MSERAQRRLGVVLAFILVFGLIVGVTSLMPVEIGSSVSMLLGLILGAWAVTAWLYP